MNNFTKNITNLGKYNTRIQYDFTNEATLSKDLVVAILYDLLFTDKMKPVDGKGYFRFVIKVVYPSGIISPIGKAIRIGSNNKYCLEEVINNCGLLYDKKFGLNQLK